ELVPTDLRDEVLRQLLRVEKLQERQVRIDAREDQVGAELVAVRRDNAGSPTVADHDPGHGRLGADFGAGLARGRRDGIRDGARPAAGEAPRSKRAVNL